MKILNWFKNKQPVTTPAIEPVSNYRENLRKAVEKARTQSDVITHYDYPIKPPDILKGVVPENETAPVLAMDSNSSYELAGQMYPTGGFVGFPYLAQLATRAEYRAFSSAISTEITRKWIAFTSTQTDGDDHSEKIKLIEAEFKRLKIRSLIQSVAENDVLFGRGHIAIKIKGHDDEKPLILAPQTIAQGSIDSFSSVEPIWSTPSAYNAIDPTAKDFYRPTSWYVLGKKIHANRFLTVVTRPLPDILKPAFNFAGISLSQLAEPYVNNWLRTRQSVSDLINNFSLTILKTSLDQVLSGGDGSDIDSRAQLFILNKSNKGLMIVDNDRESIEQINTPLGGLHELQAQSQEHMCSISKIPAVVLTGISPNGMNASSEGEMRAFNDWIAAQQEAFYRDPLEIILKIVQLHLFGEINNEIGFKFNPLMEMTAEQLANIRNTNAQVAVNYISAGVLDPAEERERLASDPDSGYQGIEVDIVPEQPEQPDTEENQPDDIEAALDGWITLNGGSKKDGTEGGGSHVFIGKGGQIEKGAGSLVGKKLSDLGGKKKFTKYETNAERHQAKTKAAYEKQESEKPMVINEDKHGRRLSQSGKGFHATNQFGNMETFETERQALNFINKADKGSNIEPFSKNAPKEKKEKLFSLKDKSRLNEIESARLKSDFDRNSEEGKSLLEERKSLIKKSQAMKHETNAEHEQDKQKAKAKPTQSEAGLKEIKGHSTENIVNSILYYDKLPRGLSPSDLSTSDMSDIISFIDGEYASYIPESIAKFKSDLVSKVSRANEKTVDLTGKQGTVVKEWINNPDYKDKGLPEYLKHKREQKNR